MSVRLSASLFFFYILICLPGLFFVPVWWGHQRFLLTKIKKKAKKDPALKPSSFSPKRRRVQLYRAERAVQYQGFGTSTAACICTAVDHLFVFYLLGVQRVDRFSLVIVAVIL